MSKQTPEQEVTRLDVWLWPSASSAPAPWPSRPFRRRQGQGSAAAPPKPAKAMHIATAWKSPAARTATKSKSYPQQPARLAPQAQQCYRETEESRTTREAAAQQRRLTAAGYGQAAHQARQARRRLIRPWRHRRLLKQPQGSRAGRPQPHRPERAQQLRDLRLRLPVIRPLQKLALPS